MTDVTGPPAAAAQPKPAAARRAVAPLLGLLAGAAASLGLWALLLRLLSALF